ncbi:LysR family transcriptional regulator [Variovorax sp. J22P271]|uniref:LysR family transcriptional regulator n=1 Tax=Variovorax davisae TaxID=3053515 RepID=UPI0025771321|nr:LysR family transcriptional regulator [Variovorax sp. J22P271]MDM0030705.1 LysR family transcriptional regulator [Variovorax sp. J22P271]
MQLRQLQHLVALAEQGSFGRAAEAAHLTQPALSRSIDKLEEDLQARLVDRAYGQVRFTAAGELVLARARELLADAGQVRRDVRMLQGLSTGSLQVGLGPFAAGMLGRPALSLMAQRHPQLVVRIDVADPNSLSERLHRRQLDLFIADTRDLKKQPGLQFKRLPNVAASFFVREGHPLLAHGGVTLDQAMDYPVASPNLPAAVASHFDKQVKRVDRPVFNMVCDDLGTLRHLALTADAVILAPDAVGLNHGTESLLRLRVKRLTRMQTHYSIVMLANRTLSPAALAFTALVHDMMDPAAGSTSSVAATARSPAAGAAPASPAAAG